MSVATVRAALAAFFATGCASGAVPGVSRVYKAIPWFVAGSQWQLSDEFGSGAIAFLHLEESGESRAADPAQGATEGVTGVKLVHYQVDLVVLYQYLIPSGTQQQVSEDAWIDPLDATIQGLKDLIHSDPTSGTGPQGVVFEIGQDEGDLKVSTQLPMRTPAKIWTWPVLQFSAYEVVNA